MARAPKARCICLSFSYTVLDMTSLWVSGVEAEVMKDIQPGLCLTGAEVGFRTGISALEVEGQVACIQRVISSKELNEFDEVVMCNSCGREDCEE